MTLSTTHPLPTDDSPTTTEPAEAVPTNITPAPRGAPTVECIDCGHLFSIDSSPELHHCWQCSEAADAEAVTR